MGAELDYKVKGMLFKVRETKLQIFQFKSILLFRY